MSVKNACTAFLVSLIAFTSIILIYKQPLKANQFYHDDEPAVESNESIRDLSNLKAIWDCFNSRFLVGLSFAVNYKIGGLNPSHYRFTNLLIHILNSIFVFLLCFITLKRQKESTQEKIILISLTAGLIFLFHPIQTEAVNFITQRFVLLATTFYLLSIIFYAYFRNFQKKLYLILSLLSALAAMFCKEFSITLPLAILFYEIYFFRNKGSTIQSTLKLVWPYLILLTIIPITLLRTSNDMVYVARIADLESHHLDITRAGNTVLNRYEYFLTELNVLRTYVKLFFIPIGQNFNYNYPFYKTIFNLHTLISFIFNGVIIYFSFYLFNRNRMMSFCILFFFLALGVESSFIPIGHVIAEYRLYLATVGLAILISICIWQHIHSFRKSLIVCYIIIFIFGWLTLQRNSVWACAISLWQDSVQKSTNNARSLHNLGHSYLKDKQYDLGISYLSQTITIFPKFIQAYHNRGDAYLLLNKNEKAINDYNTALNLKSDEPRILLNRGNAYRNLNKLDLAIEDYNQALKLNPKYAEAYNSRGYSYYLLKKFNSALKDYTKAIELKPNFSIAYNNRGTILGGAKQYTLAINDFTKAIEYNPNFAESYYNRSRANFYIYKYKQAADDAQKAISLNYNVDPSYLKELTQYQN